MTMSRLPFASIVAAFSVILGGWPATASTVSFAAAALPSSAQTTKLEVRLAEKEPGAGLSEAAVAGSGEKIYLHQDAVVTNADVVSAHVIPGNTANVFNVGVMFSSDGSAKLEKATQAHLNKPLAILVNGRVLMAPTLRSEIRGSAVITGDLTKAEAEAIASGLNAR
jgi:preprotein translocase subunit SecD